MTNNIRVRALGFHRNNKRLWFTPAILKDANIAGGEKVSTDFNKADATLIVKLDPNGDRQTTQTGKGGVFDINNKDLSEFFVDHEKVQISTKDGVIIVTGHHGESKIIEREESLIRRLKTNQPLRKGAGFTGLGLLCQSIHRGLKKAGIAVKQRFANEFNPIAAEVNIQGNEIWNDAFDDAVFVVDDIYTMDMDLVPKLDFLVMGSPCPAFSKWSTKRQREGKKDIFHPESGTIFQPILEFIKKANPAVFLLENSKYFIGSIFDYIMTDVLTRLGYVSNETVVSGTAFGDFEKRERVCRVWYSKGLPELSLENLPFQKANERTFGSVLEPIADDDPRWGRRKYLEAKHDQPNNGHKYRITDLAATKIPVCGAHYYKTQPDSAMILHPTEPLVTRTMTPSEHCNMRDITGPLKDNVVAVAEGTHISQPGDRGSVSEAHRMLGNSCSPLPWISAAYRIGKWFLSMISDTKKEKDGDDFELQDVSAFMSAPTDSQMALSF